FYKDVMGLPLRFDSPEWTEFATDGATLALHRSESGNAKAHQIQSHPTAGTCRPGFSLPDLEGFHKRMVENSVVCVQPPKDVFGVRIAQYLDPDGLVVSVSQDS